jgi:murein DD-endopeptidase MepM/ murein hydrolase activator NlpD
MRIPSSRPTSRRPLTPGFVAVLAVGVTLILTSGAPAQDLQSQLDQKQAQLSQAKQQEGVLSTTIQRYSGQIDTLSGQVATLRNREAAVQQELDQKQAELESDQHQLQVLRVRLHRSIKSLDQRLVAIYKSDAPDALSVILNAHGFDDVLTRYTYLRRIEEQDTSIVTRVRVLRNKTKDTVVRVRAERNDIAAKRDELARTRSELEGRESELSSARSSKRQALSNVQDTAQHLEGDVSDIQGQIQAQLQAAQAAEPAQPAGPVQGETGSGQWIWPVNGPITSPFCETRPWEACHPGIDIGVPTGTPIHAADDGTVAIAGPESGYGNYTCIDHGGGLSSCYGHQESISVSVGQHVSQGQVIGISDCTGLCFGPHLHFEARVNGQPVDPMGYL